MGACLRGGISTGTSFGAVHKLAKCKLKSIDFWKSEGLGKPGKLGKQGRGAELTAVRHVARFSRCRYLLEGERIYLLFLLKA